MASSSVGARPALITDDRRRLESSNSRKRNNIDSGLSVCEQHGRNQGRSGGVDGVDGGASNVDLPLSFGAVPAGRHRRLALGPRLDCPLRF